MSDDLCPYCSGVKRIRDDFIYGTHRYIIEIKNGNELWSIFISANEEHRVMQYIKHCPMCGRRLNND